VVPGSVFFFVSREKKKKGCLSKKEGDTPSAGVGEKNEGETQKNGGHCPTKEKEGFSNKTASKGADEKGTRAGGGGAYKKGWDEEESAQTKRMNEVSRAGARGKAGKRKRNRELYNPTRDKGEGGWAWATTFGFSMGEKTRDGLKGIVKQTSGK